MKARTSRLCVICGSESATTDDHIPPKSIFPKPRPSDLITVRTCRSCNNGASELEEVFKVFMGFAAGFGREGERMFREQTSRTLLHNRRLKREIADSMCDLPVMASNGTVLGTLPAVRLNSRAHDLTIEKMIRGLHFHHTGVVVAGNADLSVNWHTRLSKEMWDMSEHWNTGVVGGGQFIYKFVTPSQVPYASIWILQFFGRAWSSGTVFPKTAK